MMDSAIGRFRDAWERRNRKRVSETYILETTEFSVLETAVEPETWGTKTAKTDCESMPHGGGDDMASQIEREGSEGPSDKVENVAIV